jgi:glycosyltransferase involved in cell wall biosynthesis
MWAMSAQPRVSAIITTYRRADVLPRAIRSALSQTVSDIEVLVVDDEPSEAAAAVVHDMGDARVRYLPHDVNRGLSAARNTGIAAARAPFVAFLDDDDEWAPDKLERQLAAMHDHGDEAVVTSYERWVRPDRAAMVRAVHLDGDVHRTLLHDDMVHMQTLLLPTSAFSAVGTFDEELFHHEDLDMALRLSRRFRFVTVPEPLTIVHVTPGSLSRNTGNRIRALEHIIDKHPELRESRRLRSRWIYRLGRLHGEAEGRPAWRSSLVEAIRLDPLNVRAVAMLVVGSVLGPRAHLRLAAARGRFTRRLRSLRRGGSPPA